VSVLWRAARFYGQGSAGHRSFDAAVQQRTLSVSRAAAVGPRRTNRATACRHDRRIPVTGHSVVRSHTLAIAKPTKPKRNGRSTSAAVQRRNGCTIGAGVALPRHSFASIRSARASSARVTKRSRRRTPSITIRRTTAIRSASGMSQRGERWLTVTTPAKRCSRMVGSGGERSRRGRGSKSLASSPFATSVAGKRACARIGTRFRVLTLKSASA
jgi:hypothetical protein